MRYSSIDGLRGIFILMMASTHYMILGPAIEPPGYHWIGFADTAQGFVFVSGLVLGIVLTRRLARTGPQEVRRYALGRMAKIYKYHAATLLFAIAVTFWIPGLPVEVDAGTGHPGANALLGLLLIHQPHFLDVLPLYLFLVALAPFVIEALDRGAERAVLAISVVAWCAAQISPLKIAYEVFELGAGRIGLTGSYHQTFELFAWQILFVAGLVIGWRIANDRFPIARFRGDTARIAAAAAAALALLMLIYDGMSALPVDRLSDIGNRLDLSQSKWLLSPYVLTDFACLAYLVAWLMIASDAQSSRLVRLAGQALRWIAGQAVFQRIGRQSIRAFSAHLFFLFPAAALITGARLSGWAALALYLLGMAWVVAVAEISDRRRLRARSRPEAAPPPSAEPA